MNNGNFTIGGHNLIVDKPISEQTDIFVDKKFSLNIDDVVPYIEKDVVLFDEGTWNNVYISSDTIKKAFESTDWNERKNRDLFYDHEDSKASEWIGEVFNIRYSGNKLVGDLKIYDFNTALKMKFGKPKFGISPRIVGKQNTYLNKLESFVFKNFSIVYNPAVKTAYINNSSNEKNNVIKLYKIDKKFNEEQGGNMVDENVGNGNEDVGNTENTNTEENNTKNENETVGKVDEKKDNVDELKNKIEELEKKLGELQKPKESENVNKDIDDKLSAIEQKIVSFDSAINTIKESVVKPDRKSVRTDTAISRNVAKAKVDEMMKNTDKGMFEFIKGMINGGYN